MKKHSLICDISIVLVNKYLFTKASPCDIQKNLSVYLAYTE